MAPFTRTTVALAALMRLRGVGRKQALRTVSRALPENESAKLTLLDLADRARLPTGEVNDAWGIAEDQLGQSAKVGISAICLHDQTYPARLKDTPDPPAILFVKGDPAGLHAERAIAVVGTREPTEYGVKVARKLAARLAADDYVIVSGLAHGCDTLGHEGCLDAGGTGLAVMAHGLDRVYPAANRDLAERLLANGGCLVSEYPVGMTPMRTAFAERDRIQSGLSEAILVIETDVKGGTMHTVRFARDQGRPLACVAHPDKWLIEEKTRGNQKLIADGWATPIPDGEALVGFLESVAERRKDNARPEMSLSRHGDHQQSFVL